MKSHRFSDLVNDPADLLTIWSRDYGSLGQNIGEWDQVSGFLLCFIYKNCTSANYLTHVKNFHHMHHKK